MIWDANDCPSSLSAPFAFVFTAIDDLSVNNSAVRIYPNPVSGILYIEPISNQSKGFYVQLLNTTGQLMIQENQARQLDVSRLNPGMYFLRIMFDGEQAVSYKINILK
jgi:hypothetical protein